jgi:hypothetical protein
VAQRSRDPATRPRQARRYMDERAARLSETSSSVRDQPGACWAPRRAPTRTRFRSGSRAPCCPCRTAARTCRSRWRQHPESPNASPAWTRTAMLRVAQPSCLSHRDTPSQTTRWLRDPAELGRGHPASIAERADINWRAAAAGRRQVSAEDRRDSGTSIPKACWPLPQARLAWAKRVVCPASSARRYVRGWFR